MSVFRSVPCRMSLHSSAPTSAKGKYPSPVFYGSGGGCAGALQLLQVILALFITGRHARQLCDLNAVAVVRRAGIRSSAEMTSVPPCFLAVML